MNHTKSLLKIVTLAFVLLAAAVIAFLIFRPSPVATVKETKGDTSTTKSFKALEAQDIAGEGFGYTKPVGWAKLSKELLESSAATSGIGRLPSSGKTPLPVATFTVKIASSTPKNDADLKNSVLTELKKLAKFEQGAITPTEVGGKPGQKFLYTFGDKEKTRQELNVMVHNKKTFFILSSSTEGEFEKHTDEFAKILSSFKFK